MTRENQDIRINQRETPVVETTVLNDSGNPEPLDTADITYALADDADANEPLLTKTRADGISTPDTGEVRVLLDEDDTDLDAELYYHELRVTKDGNSAVVMTGKVRVSPSQT